MTVIKQYNVGTSAWETVVVGAQGPQGPQGAQGGIVTVAYRTSVYSNATVTPTQVIGYTDLANTAFVGKAYRLTAFGYRTGTNNSGAVIKVNIDGSTTSWQLTHAGSATASGFGISAYITITAIGASGTAWIQGSTYYGTTSQVIIGNGSSVISTTSDSLIELTLASGNAANTYFVTYATIEAMN